MTMSYESIILKIFDGWRTPQEVEYLELDLRPVLLDPDLTVVFVNGCFDVLHVGHAHLLNYAHALPDVSNPYLVVGLNGDASAGRLKGPGRPVNPWKARALCLASLACVDAVVGFDEDTPEELIAYLKPFVLLKAHSQIPADPLTIPGVNTLRSYGGGLYVCHDVPGVSTSRVLRGEVELASFEYDDQEWRIELPPGERVQE